MRLVIHFLHVGFGSLNQPVLEVVQAYRPLVTKRNANVRVYLSSYRIGDYPEKLVDISGQGRVAIIGNALDFRPPEARRQYEAEVYNPFNEFAALGLEAAPLDLRTYFGNPRALSDALRKFGMVWLLGGNAFLLMRAIRQSGFEDVIRPMLAADEIAYGGFSAGAVVATPHLRGIELMDEPEQLAEGYDADIIWKGMGIVDFAIVPHYRSDHHEAEAAEKAVAFMKATQIPFKAMTDGDVYAIHNGQGEHFLSSRVKQSALSP